MMSSVPVVKPPMPTSNPQPPKVMSGAPSATQLVGPPAAPIVVQTKVMTSPGKPSPSPNANHTSAVLPLSLVQEHKMNASTLPVQQLPAPRTPEKKEPQAARPTTNGMEGSQSRQPSVPEVKKPDDGAVAATIVNHSLEVVQPAPAPAMPPLASTTPLVQAPALQPSAPVAVGQQSLVKPGQVPPPAAGTQLPSMVAPGLVEAKPPTLPVPELQHPPIHKPVLEVKRTVEPPPKPEFKVATPPRNNKRKREVKPAVEMKTPSQSDERKSKRVRTRTQPYQSPLPELLFISKMKTPMKSPDDKLIVFYKNEFLAVRNAEGSFYVCQAMQNIYKTSPKIRIRWLSQEKKENKLTDVYVPDFYDTTDFDCILTNLDLKRLDRNRYQLPDAEHERTQSILKRALDVEKGVSEKPSVTEEHPDGLDLSLFRDESQLKTRRNSKQATKRKKAKGKENSEVQAEGSSTKRKSRRKAKRTKSREQSGARLEKKKAEGGARDRAAAAKRRSEVAAALAKQAAVKQTVARGALPKPPPPKKARASPPQAAPTPIAAPSPAKSPKKAETVPEPPSPSRSSKTRSAKAVPTPPKTVLTTRTKERDQQRGATSPTAVKGRKKPGKKA